jgi:hypothetical protein
VGKYLYKSTKKLLASFKGNSSGSERLWSGIFRDTFFGTPLKGCNERVLG